MALDPPAEPAALGGELTAAYTPPTAEQLRWAQLEMARLASQREHRRVRLAELRARQESEASSDADSPGMRMRHLMEQADLLSSLALLADSGGGAAPTAKDSRKANATKHQGRRGVGRMSEKEEDEMMLKLNEGGDGGGSQQSCGLRTRLTTQPSCIQGTMRAYQLEGLNWLIRAYESGVNGILADEMGLGKTLQTVSLLGYLKEQLGISGPHLVIVPKSTLGNWFGEIRRWCPLLAAFKLHGDKATRKALIDTVLFGGEFDVCITTYEVVIAEKSALCKLNWHYLIIDEAHRIKNESSILSQTVRLFDVAHRLLITGTPLQNNLHELWAMLHFLLPDAFNDAAAFDQFGSDADGSESSADSVIGSLHQLLKPVLLRRLKTEVERELPPKRELKLFVGLSAMQRHWYTSILSKNIDALNDMGANKVRMLNILMQLRKCCNHPYLFDGAETPPFINDDRLITNSGKFGLLDKLLPRLKADGHRVLIFSQMTRMLDILEDYLWYRGHLYCRIDGSTSAHERDERIDAFNSKGSTVFVFLLSTRAGGLGINLTSADTVILYDSDWNPQMDLQAMDRAHRIGQTKPVMVYRFVTESTVEEKIIERAQKKLYLDALVIQQGRLAEKERGLGKEELLGMIRFGADAIFKSSEEGATEQDLDAILRRGDETAAVESERLQSSEQNLLNFSIGTSAEKSIYEYGEVGEAAAPAPAPLPFISLPQRERKKNYNDEEAYREMMRELEGAKQRASRPTGSRRGDLDFQFWNERMEGGEPSDRFSNWSRKEYNAFIRACEIYGRDDVAAITAEVNNVHGDVGLSRADTMCEMEASNSEEAATAESKGEGVRCVVEAHAESSKGAIVGDARKIEGSVGARKIEGSSRDTLNNEGTILDDAKRKGLKLDSAVNERHMALDMKCEEKTDDVKCDGENIDDGKSERGMPAEPSRGEGTPRSVTTEGGKSAGVGRALKNEADVRAYMAVFFARFKEVKDGEKIVRRIEANERRRRAQGNTSESLRRKLAMYDDPLEQLVIKYGLSRHEPKYTESCDRFLLVQTAELGYGKWDQLKLALLKSERFSFDYFGKSRAPQELGRRVDALLKLVEREMEQLSKQESMAVGGKKRPRGGKSPAIVEGELFTSDLQDVHSSFAEGSSPGGDPGSQQRKGRGSGRGRRHKVDSSDAHPLKKRRALAA